MKFIILGPQGSGKGTQADLLATRFGIPHLDIGQILREHIANKTPIGKNIEAAMKKGELLPSDIVNKVVEERLEQEDCTDGFVLDGYPRELNEAEALDELTDIDAVVMLDIPDEVAVKRLSARRVCIGCTAPLYGLPKDIGKECSSCNGKLAQRDDDQPEVVKKRLEVYHEETEPLVEYYRPRGIVHKVDGQGTIEDVFRRIMTVIS
jgi:adenylate kinase